MATKLAPKTKKAITLKGSTQIVTEFLKYASYTILYQRGVYPQDDFHFVKKYGQTLLVSQDPALERYLDTVLKKVHEWIMGGDVSQIVLVILSRETGESLERWTFDIHLTEPVAGVLEGTVAPKPDSEIQSEIRAILKQISSAITFLPDHYDPTTFKLLAYTRDNGQQPVEEWVGSDAHLLPAAEAQQVKLRSFSTDLHKIEAMVAYRYTGEGA
ncbi:Mitotic spindle checkpoint component mad2 [Ceratobasidium sp. 392]|nr:Mitotic spindle checkpoint component mad2 [Ceratobasidium sp. 392]